MGQCSSTTPATPPWKVFGAFLKLGVTSFGGPIAHLSYFRREFVDRRGWLTEPQYAQLLALCQFLPGPASSQLGFALGLWRGGFAGALAAFAAFTLPSALLMFAFATWLPALPGSIGAAVAHGLKLIAVAVVAHALLTMTRQLCPDWTRRIIALLATCLMLLWNVPWAQLIVIGCGALAGMRFCAPTQGLAGTRLPWRHGARLCWTLLGVYAVLLVLALWVRFEHPLLMALSAFYRAGALVFGGGHVVLPLLQESVVDWGLVSADDFLAGYGAAQAMPGPMFTLAAYLGAVLPDGNGGVLGASLALLAIFLPGFLLVSGTLPLWHALGTKPEAAHAVAGINAAVVGLLAAAFYDPVWTGGISGVGDAVIALIGFLLLLWRLSAVWVVAWCVSAAIAMMQFSGSLPSLLN